MPSRVTSLIRWSALLLVVACSSSSVAEAQDSRDAPVAQASAPAQVAQQAPGSAPSSLPRRTMTAVRLNEGETIDLDGDLDEGVWARALPASDFRQQDPDNGEAATEPTEVRIVFGEDALYMGVICFDSEPDRWLGYQRGRDGSLTADDRFMWTIDTFLDGRSSYFFEMNPSGLMADALRGVRDQQPAVGWNLDGQSGPHRDRVDAGDRDSVSDAELRSRQRHVGYQLPADRPAQERGKPLDGVAP